MPTELATNPHRLTGPQAAAANANARLADMGRTGAIFGVDGFGFDDFLDIINPLQQIPIIGSIYRELTGDTIAPGAQLIGGSLLGGVGGFMASAANIFFTQETGENGMAGSVLAALTDDVNRQTQLAFAKAGESAASSKGQSAIRSVPEVPDSEKFALQPFEPQLGMQVAEAMQAPAPPSSPSAPAETPESIKAAAVNEVATDMLLSHLQGMRTGMVPSTAAERQYKRAQALGALEDRALQF